MGCRLARALTNHTRDMGEALTLSALREFRLP